MDSELKELLEVILDKVASLDNKATLLDNKVTSLDYKVTSLDNKATLLDNKVTSLDNKVTSLEQSVTTLQTDIRDVKHTVKKTAWQMDVLYDWVDSVDLKVKNNTDILNNLPLAK